MFNLLESEIRVILLGNAGAGKSTMARHMIGNQDIPCLSLDMIAWNEGPQRKPLDESSAELLEFIHGNKQWIIEGCYGDLVEVALPYCRELRFLNPGVETCIQHCYHRPWEPDKFSSEEEQNIMLNALIEWVKHYETRQDEYGLLRHQSLYEAFEGRKQKYTKVEDYF